MYMCIHHCDALLNLTKERPRGVCMARAAVEEAFENAILPIHNGRLFGDESPGSESCQVVPCTHVVEDPSRVSTSMPLHA